LRFGNARKHALKKLGCRGFSLYSDGHPRNLVVALRRLWRLRLNQYRIPSPNSHGVLS
jgi:hypothetical protein